MAIDAAASGSRARNASAVSRWLRPHRPVAAWVPVFAGLSPTLLTIAWLIGDAVQPTSYSPMRQTVSVLAGRAGTDRWIRHRRGCNARSVPFRDCRRLRVLPLRARVGLVVAGLAAIGIAASPQPVSGAGHSIWYSPALVRSPITVWPALAAQRRAPASILVSASYLGRRVLRFPDLALLDRGRDQVGGSLGLAERVSSAIQTGWPVAVAVSLRRTKRSDPDNRGRRERSGAN